MLELTADKLFPAPKGGTQDRCAFQHPAQQATKAKDENWCVQHPLNELQRLCVTPHDRAVRFELVLPTSVQPVNVCKSVMDLYPASRFEEMKAPPRLPKRRGTKLDVNPYRKVNVYSPPEDYERPSISFDAGVAKRSAPPSHAVPTRRVRAWQ